jgi:arylsulfatase
MKQKFAQTQKANGAAPRRDGLGIAALAFNNLSGIGGRGTGVLKVDGKEVAAEKMERTLPLILPWDETLKVGADRSSAVGTTGP